MFNVDFHLHTWATCSPAERDLLRFWR